MASKLGSLPLLMICARVRSTYGPCVLPRVRYTQSRFWHISNGALRSQENALTNRATSNNNKNPHKPKLIAMNMDQHFNELLCPSGFVFDFWSSVSGMVLLLLRLPRKIKDLNLIFALHLRRVNAESLLIHCRRFTRVTASNKLSSNKNMTVFRPTPHIAHGHTHTHTRTQWAPRHKSINQKSFWFR